MNMNMNSYDNNIHIKLHYIIYLFTYTCLFRCTVNGKVHRN